MPHLKGNAKARNRQFNWRPRSILPGHFARHSWKYDTTMRRPRLQDLEQLELLASRFQSRSQMLADLTLDPPESTQDLAGDPVLDEDYFILSTIHSEKGLEWDSLYVIHAVDGNIPSDKATGSPEQIDEELRLFYLALTRVKRSLTVCVPLAYHYAARGPSSDKHTYAQRSRVHSRGVLRLFDCLPTSGGTADEVREPGEATVSESARRRELSMWS